MEHKPTLDFFRRHGVQMLELEPGPDAPTHIGRSKLTFGIFDGFALAALTEGATHTHSLSEFRFIKLTYPTLAEIRECEYYQEHIRKFRFAGQVAPGGELFAEDAASCFGKAHDVTLADFEISLKAGLAQMGKKPRHLHVYRNETEFLTGMDGKIYGVCDTSGKWFCDLYIKQFLYLTDEEILIDTSSTLDYPAPKGIESDVILADEKYRQFVYDRRIEILNLYQ